MTCLSYCICRLSGVAIAFSLLSCSNPTEGPMRLSSNTVGASVMSNATIENLGALLDKLVTLKPFDRNSFELLFSSQLRRVGGNNFYDFYEGSQRVLDGISVGGIELRARKNATNVGLISIDVFEPCILLSDLERRYVITAIFPPSGNLPNEMTYYNSDNAWGSLRFGFLQENPDCLARVIFEVPDSRASFLNP